MLFFPNFTMLHRLASGMMFVRIQQVPAAAVAANQNGNQWRIQQCLPQVRHRLIRATVKICAS